MIKTNVLRATAIALSLSAFPASADETPSFMFVQTADNVVIDQDAKTFRMVGVSPQTLYFSDRPNRLAGHIPMDAYLREWSEGPQDFDNDPPNATLSVYESDQDSNEIVVVELLDPAVEGEDLIYRYNIVEGEMPAGGGAAALFVDKVGPGGGVGAGYHGVGVGARGPGVAGWAGVAARTDCASGGC